MFGRFINRIATKMGRAEAWVKRATTSIASGVNQVIADVAEFCGDEKLCSAAKKRQQEFERQNGIWRKRMDELKVKDRYEAKGGCSETPDIQLVKDVTLFLDHRYERQARKRIKDMSPLERTKEVETVAMEFGKIFGVEIKKVNIFIPDKKQINNCGSYDWSEGTVNINISQMFSDDERVLVDVISTVAHELYHARQWNAAIGKKDYGYSSEKQLIWANNFMQYYPPEFGPLYYYQPLEADARGLENAIKDSLR